MTTEKSQSTLPASPILLILVGILAGFVGGFFVGQQGPMAVTAGAVAAGPCPDELAQVDEYIIAGFICPIPPCQDELLTCHCEGAHKMKNKIKQELAQGKDGLIIREELKAQYGAALEPRS